MYVFGPGNLIVTPNNVSNPTPINIGYAQEITFSEKASLKPLYGFQKRALVVAGGTIETTVKVKNARFSLKALNAAYYGQNLGSDGGVTTGGHFGVPPPGEAHAVPGTSPYTVTISPPGSGTFYADQGVVYAATGIPFLKVASSPAQGEYTQSSGTYTFATADEGAAILINYTYSSTTSGQSLLVANQQLGTTASVGAVINVVDPSTNSISTLEIFNIVFSSLNPLSTKLEDFAMPELEGSCFVNGAGNIYQWNIADNF